MLEDGTAEITNYLRHVDYDIDTIEIHIPDELDGITVSSIKGNPFRNYDATAFTVSPDQPYFEVVDDVLFSKAGQAAHCLPADEGGDCLYNS